MKKITFLSLLAALLLSSSPGVLAQFGIDYVTEQPSWNLHAGAAFMLGDTPDDVEVIVGLGYETPFSEYDMRDWLGFSIDYIPVTTQIFTFIIGPDGQPVVVATDSDTVSLFPILLYWKKTSLLVGNRVWGAVGIGGFLASDDIPEMDLSDGLNFAWTLQAGIDFTPDFFASVRYIAGENPGDDGILTADLGYRF